MCVIVICPKGLRPSIHTLKACAKTNPDGAGVAWRSNGEVKWAKGIFDPEQLKKLVDAVEGEIVIHFRWASVGGKAGGLCHPFPIEADAVTALEGTANSVLFHNGTWGQWRETLNELAPGLDGPVSDTRVAAIRVHYEGEEALVEMAGRWVVFGHKKTELCGDFQSRKGLRYSNLNWVRNLPENLRGGPVRIVEEHGTCTPKRVAVKAAPQPRGEEWEKRMQRMANQHGQRIVDSVTGREFTPEISAPLKFDYRRWLREQRELFED